MKVRGDTAPGTAFTLEPIPKKPGKSLIRFYENAEQFTEIREGVTVTGWKWDEYHLEMNGYTGLLNDVTANHDTLLAQAQRVEYEANANDIIQAATDELMIDHEERLIYLELGV